MCGITIAFKPSPPVTYETSGFFCGKVEPKTKHWTPKSATEVKCVLEGLPPEHLNSRKLRVQAYKGSCGKFLLCDFEFETNSPFKTDIVPFDPMPGNRTNTCLVFTFDLDKGVASNIRLREAECTESSAFICVQRDF
ncbi:uncharacterized protein LOC135947346 [Cloeon dipterum]|uniref:uncharacterized protein LOC135947346 n=1 Tax=Cloeon dipterum TaxID=197152 RepID=UPI00321FA2D2